MVAASRAEVDRAVVDDLALEYGLYRYVSGWWDRATAWWAYGLHSD